MDDVLKGLIVGIFSLFVVHSSLEKRVSHDATHQVQDSFDHTGSVRTRVEPRGMFGVFANDIFAIDVYGDRLSSEQLPFVAIPKQGWKGSIRHLRLHFTNLTLRGLPVDRFEADIPSVTYDLGHALYRDRLVIRGSGIGPSSVVIGPDGLRTFILHKFKQTLSDINVEIVAGKVIIHGKLAVLGDPSPFAASGSLLAREGRYIDLVEPVMELNGKLLTPQAAASILKQINPVLDADVDLGLRGYFRITDVEVRKNNITISGTSGIPTNTE